VHGVRNDFEENWLLARANETQCKWFCNFWSSIELMMNCQSHYDVFSKNRALDYAYSDLPNWLA